MNFIVFVFVAIAIGRAIVLEHVHVSKVVDEVYYGGVHEQLLPFELACWLRFDS